MDSLTLGQVWTETGPLVVRCHWKKNDLNPKNLDETSDNKLEPWTEVKTSSC